MVQTVFFWMAKCKMSNDQVSPLTQVFVILVKKKRLDCVKLKYYYITVNINILLQQVTKKRNSILFLLYLNK